MSELVFMPGDKVRYIGNKFSPEIGNKVGEIDIKIKDSNAYVVSFINGHRDTGEIDKHSYICSEHSLMKVNK